MERQTFLNQCITQNYSYSYLVKKIYQIKDQICDPKAVLDDLYGDTILKCHTKVKYDKITTIHQCDGVIWRQAYETFIDYYRSLKIKQRIIVKFGSEAIYKPIDGIATGYFEFTDVISFIKKHLTEEQFNLFHMRVFENISYEDLGIFFNKKPSTLRKSFQYIKVKIEKLLIKEKIYNP